MYGFDEDSIIINQEEFLINPKYKFKHNPYDNLPDIFRLSDLHFAVIFANYKGQKDVFKKVGIGKKDLRREVELTNIVTIPLYVKNGIFDLRSNTYVPNALCMNKLVESYAIEIDGDIDYSMSYKMVDYDTFCKMLGKSEIKAKSSDRVSEIALENEPKTIYDINKFAVDCDEVFMKSVYASHRADKQKIKNDNYNLEK